MIEKLSIACAALMACAFATRPGGLWPALLCAAVVALWVFATPLTAALADYQGLMMALAGGVAWASLALLVYLIVGPSAGIFVAGAPFGLWLGLSLAGVRR